MGFLKSQKVSGVHLIKDPVKFLDYVQSSFMEPWGTQWYVDATNGDNNYTGRGPSVAKKTIQAAVTAAVGGDTIYVRPQVYKLGSGFTRYEEDVVIAQGTGDSSGETDTNARMSIIGITSNTGNADYGGVRWKHTTSVNLTVNANACHIENIGFFSEGATYGVLLNTVAWTAGGGNGTSFYNCALKGKGIYVVGGGDGLTIEKTRFQCAYNGTVAQLNYSCSAGSGRRLTVRGCTWLDGNGNVPSGPCITMAAPATEFLITDCNFPQLPTGSVYIATAGANEGLISNCYFNIADLDTNSHITLGAAVLAVACYDEAGLAFTS